MLIKQPILFTSTCTSYYDKHNENDNGVSIFGYSQIESFLNTACEDGDIAPNKLGIRWESILMLQIIL